MLFIHYLQSERNKLILAKTSLSDTLLALLKAGRGVLTESWLVLFNRELLGYLEDEAQDFSILLKDLWDEQTPLHRVMPGLWVPLAINDPDPAGDYGREFAQEGAIFYHAGLSELENLLDHVSISEYSWVCVAMDREQDAVFMCNTKQLKAFYEAARQRLCVWIDKIIAELKTMPDTSQLNDWAPRFLQ